MLDPQPSAHEGQLPSATVASTPPQALRRRRRREVEGSSADNSPPSDKAAKWRRPNRAAPIPALPTDYGPRVFRSDFVIVSDRIGLTSVNSGPAAARSSLDQDTVLVRVIGNGHGTPLEARTASIGCREIRRCA